MAISSHLLSTFKEDHPDPVSITKKSINGKKWIKMAIEIPL